MVDKKYERVVFALFMSLFMSFFMSFIITLINIGFIGDFVYIWLQAFWKAFIIAFPTIIIIVPQVRKLVLMVIKE